MRRIFNALLQFRNPILYFFLLGLSISFTVKQSAFHEFNIQKYGCLEITTRGQSLMRDNSKFHF